MTVEASYTVGEYDIVILSAEQSDGLVTVAGDGMGTRFPKEPAAVLGSYIKQNMKFFVAKVNLAKHQAGSGFTYLGTAAGRVQVAEIHAADPARDGQRQRAAGVAPSYTLTKKGRVETTNYRTVKLPSDVEVPRFSCATISRASIATCLPAPCSGRT